ncbi:MAG: HYR domain-containing protein [Phycisphaerales bacterium]|nr:HYR domain-containing protein [Phycisphaerales bacterium]MCB9857325.1 HYR domain-containing protein [Phycisphaerales bacterium]MCB9862961.1 HYR domain-containing protein [Phycisphaerales bacterium]
MHRIQRRTAALIRILATVFVLAVSSSNVQAGTARFDSMEFVPVCGEWTVHLNADGTKLATIGWDGADARGFTYWSDCAGLRIFPDLFKIPNGENVIDMSADGKWIVGYTFQREESIHGSYRMTPEGDIQPIGHPPFYDEVYAQAISDDGAIIAGITRGEIFRWTESGGFELIDLGDYGIDRVNVIHMVGDGSVIVGESNQVAFRWTESEGATTLGHLRSPILGNYYETRVAGVSANGNAVVGSSLYDDELNARAFRWTQETGMTALDDDPDTTYAWPSGVSADGGVIIGTIDRRHGAGGSFIWDAAHGTRMIRDALVDEYGLAGEIDGWRLSSVLAVSDDGNVIVGAGLRPDGTPSTWRVVFDTSKLPTLVDTDADGICDDMDACQGDDTSGDSDGDGLCDDIDACISGNCVSETPVVDCPGDIRVEATSDEGAIVHFNMPTLAQMSQQKSIHADRTSGSMFPIGTTEVNVYVVDSSSPDANAIACTFNVDVSQAADVASATPPDTFQSVLQGNCFAIGAEAGLIAPFAGICLIRRKRRKRSGH